MTYNLIGVGNNAKTVKGDGSEYVTAIKYMMPYKTMFQGKVHNICAMAEKAGCHVACLNTAGRGVMTSVQKGRLRKTQLFIADKLSFMQQLNDDVHVFHRRCSKKGIQSCVRLNGTSDIQYEKLDLMNTFPDVQFYDYTKIAKRAYAELPSNYHLTLSYSEKDEGYARQIRKAVDDTGVNMAVVFGVKSADDFPATFLGLPVINGDKDDLRFLDPTHCVVGLIAKGKAKKDTSGFVVHPNEDGTWGRLQK